MGKHNISSEYTNNDPKLSRHSDEIRDIITTVPSRLIRQGMFLFFCVFAMIVGLTAFIHFPAAINVTLNIKDNSLAEIAIPQAMAAKVHTGQEVIAKFNNYQHGPDYIVKGKIVYISDSTDNYGKLIAKVLITSESNNIRLKPGMRANAHIMLENVSILKSICQNFFH